MANPADGEQGEEVFGYFYGEEDKGLMDPAWERQQKKVFLQRPKFLIY